MVFLANVVFPGDAKWLVFTRLSATDRCVCGERLWAKTANSMVFAAPSALCLTIDSGFSTRVILFAVAEGGVRKKIVFQVSFFILYTSPDMSGARHAIEVDRQHLNTGCFLST